MTCIIGYSDMDWIVIYPYLHLFIFIDIDIDTNINRMLKFLYISK